jgi:hypothetical protein
MFGAKHRGVNWIWTEIIKGSKRNAKRILAGERIRAIPENSLSYWLASKRLVKI